MNTPKNIQISYELFESISEYLDNHPDYDDYQYSSIIKAIDEKHEAIHRRNLYTGYKTGPTQEIRSAGRTFYLEAKGIPASYQWDVDQDYNVTRHMPGEDII